MQLHLELVLNCYFVKYMFSHKTGSKLGCEWTSVPSDIS